MSWRKQISGVVAILGGVGACSRDTTAPAPTNPRFMVSGVETGDRLRNVGLMVYRVPGDPTWYYWDCSGSLIARRAFLTAAHCLTGSLEPFQYGVSEFGVAFPSRLVDTGDPFNPKLPDDEPVYPGTIVTYPGAEQNIPDNFPNFDDWLATLDLAVVVLDRPVRGITPVEVPPVGWVEKHADQLKRTLTGLTGYGVTNADPFFGNPGVIDWGIRRFGTLRFARLTPTVAFLNPAPSAACYFDSGGPAFATDATTDGNLPAKIGMQYGFTRSFEFFDIDDQGRVVCAGEIGVGRLDTQAAHAFLDQFLDR